jgi:hypothetical protein
MVMKNPIAHKNSLSSDSTGESEESGLIKLGNSSPNSIPMATILEADSESSLPLDLTPNSKFDESWISRSIHPKVE